MKEYKKITFQQKQQFLFRIPYTPITLDQLKDIGYSLDLTPSQVKRIIKQMVTNNLIQTIPDLLDARKTFYAKILNIVRPRIT